MSPCSSQDMDFLNVAGCFVHLAGIISSPSPHGIVHSAVYFQLHHMFNEIMKSLLFLFKVYMIEKLSGLGST